MKRVILVVLLTAVMLATMVAGSGLPALAQAQDEMPSAPQCDWYKNWTADEKQVWWEYWCWWPGWGWEFVFWVWA